jgi:hypothetical protein
MNTTAHAPRALVVYESMFGNTEKIAGAIVRGLRSEGWNASAVDVRWSTDLPADLDLLVLGAPTHGFSLSRPSTRADAVRQGAAPARAEKGLREWLADVGAAGNDSPPVAVFDTRAAKVKRFPASAGRTIAKLARRHGFRVIGRPQGFLVHDTDGPTLAGELERASTWGRSLADVKSSP